LKELNETWPPELRLNIGIGINTGEMTVGNIGSYGAMSYTVIGDNVNLGARLEGTNKLYNTNIIVSEYTYEKVKDKFSFKELDVIKVKGKEKPVNISNFYVKMILIKFYNSFNEKWPVKLM
jgi:adenylate cyclase